MPASDALKDDATLLFDAVREAGELGRSLSRRSGLQCWTKPDGSQVTEGDLAINDLLAQRLNSARPSYGWLSEETPDLPQGRMAQEKLWIIDPIDGTRAFIEGRQEWCVAAALAIGGRPVLAAVYRPLRNEFYAATVGEGASLNGEPLRMNDPARLEGAVIAGNRKALSGHAHLGITVVKAPSGCPGVHWRAATRLRQFLRAHVPSRRLRPACSQPDGGDLRP